MRENRKDDAMVLVQHALNLCTDLNVIENAGPGMNIAVGTCGVFQFLHTTPNHYLAEEMIDVWHRGATKPQGKVLNARRLKGASDWEICNFKRGDWESAFVFTADPTDRSQAPTR